MTRDKKPGSGTIFLHPCNRNQKLERVVSRMRERQGRKHSDRQSKSRRESSKPPSSTVKRGHDGLTFLDIHEGLEEDFMPEISDLADFRFRSELIRMMGTEVIRLSNESWSQEFTQKLREDYERQLDLHEQKLAEAEKDRLRALRMKGFVTDRLTPEEEKKRNFLQRLRVGVDTYTKTQSTSTKSGPGKQPPLFKDEHNRRRHKELSARLSQRTYRAPKPGEPLEMRSHTFLAERKKKRYRYLPPEVAQLYDEETVAGLYKRALQLIGPPPPPKTEVEPPPPPQTEYS